MNLGVGVGLGSAACRTVVLIIQVEGHPLPSVYFRADNINIATPLALPLDLVYIFFF